MSDALKSNTTLTQLDLCREHKKQHTNGIHQQSTLFHSQKTTENDIEVTGATSLSEALKSNTTLTQVDLSREYKRNNTQIESINNPLSSILIKSTGNKIGEAGIESLSDALKSNTTLTELNLSREHKRNNTQMVPINNSLFSIHAKRTDNSVGDIEAASLSDALKSNKTLTKLGLICEDKRNNTQIESINNPLFSILIKSTGNKIGETGAASLSDALKSNTTLAKLDLSREYKRNNIN